MEQIRIFDTDFSGAVFERVNFTGAKLKHVSFAGASLHGLDFSKALLMEEIDFTGGRGSRTAYCRKERRDGVFCDENRREAAQIAADRDSRKFFGRKTKKRFYTVCEGAARASGRLCGSFWTRSFR